MLLYVLYGVPLTFAMAHPRYEPWYLVVIDGALALLLGYLFFVHTFSFATMSDAPEQGINSLRLMFDIENLFIAAFALVRYLASEDASRRIFFRALTAFAWVYMGVAAYINHVATEASYGGLADLIIDLPFLLLACLALRRGDAVAMDTRRRLALAVRAGSPLILPAALLVVSALMVEAHPHLAVVGFALATLGSGLRGVVMQVRAMERQDQLNVLARVDALTGVANRRQFDQVLQAEWSRARRSGQGMALLMVDIDHFKEFNDRFGHPLGDACLRAVATALVRMRYPWHRRGGPLRRRGVCGGGVRYHPRRRAGPGRDHAPGGGAVAAGHRRSDRQRGCHHQHRGGARGAGNLGRPHRVAGRYRCRVVRGQARRPQSRGGRSAARGARSTVDPYPARQSAAYPGSRIEQAQAHR